MASKPISVILRAVTGPYQAAMAQAAGTTKAFQASVQNVAPQVGNMSRGMGMLSTKLLGGAGLVMGLKSAADAAIGWESAFTGVRKTVDATEGELKSLEDGLLRMSTTLPTSAEDLAGIAEAAGQLGIQTGNIQGFTKVMADLGETTNLAGGEAATQLARFANITQMSQGDFDRLGSTIVELGNNMATTEAEIVALGLRLAGAGAQIGLSESQILALAAGLSSVGVEAEAGGSAFSRVMVEVQKSVEAGDEKLALFARTAGMSAGQFATAWRDDAAGALVSFITGLGGVIETGQGADTLLEELGLDGLRVADSLKRTAGAGDLLTEALDLGSGAWEDNLALTKEAELRYGTTESKLQMLKNQVHLLAIEFGNELKPAIDGVLGALGSDVGGEPFIGRLGEGVGKVVSTNLRLIGEVAKGITGMGTPGDVWAAWRNPPVEVDDYIADASKELGTFIPNAVAAADASSDLSGSVGDAGGEFETAAERISGATAALGSWIEKQREATDPVFALVSAVNDETEAQKAYNEAVKEHGPASDEAKEAALEHFEAQQNVAAAVAQAGDKFPAVFLALQQMAEDGRISATELGILQGVLLDVLPVADDWAGTRVARFDWEFTNWEDFLQRINAVRAALGQDPIEAIDTYTPPATLGVTPRATGGPFGHGEMMLVGEEGPELVQFGRSGTVMPARETAAALSGTRIGQQTTVAAGAVQIVTRDAQTAARHFNREVDLMAAGF